MLHTVILAISQLTYEFILSFSGTQIYWWIFNKSSEYTIRNMPKTHKYIIHKMDHDIVRAILEGANLNTDLTMGFYCKPGKIS